MRREKKWPRASTFLKNMISFRETVRKFAENRLRPHAHEWGKERGYPLELFKDFTQMGFFGIRHPEKYGGSGADYWYTVILCEELMREFNYASRPK